MRIAPLLPVAALVGALLAGATAAAEIYRWTDSSGRLHFTERLENVPLDQRDAAIESVLMSPQPPIQAFPDTEAPAPEKRRSLKRNAGVRIPFAREGTLMRVDARLNDRVTAPFLVDTGASGVSLPSHVADQLGIRVRADTPRVQVTTANGVVSRPLVRLDSVEVGGAKVEGLEATVNPRMRIGLLGGTFFNNFVYHVDAAESVITLVPNEQIRGGMGEADWRQRFQNLRRPLAKLEGHLDSDIVHRKQELETLLHRRAELEAELEQLVDEANRLSVPHAWRE